MLHLLQHWRLTLSKAWRTPSKQMTKTLLWNCCTSWVMGYKLLVQNKLIWKKETNHLASSIHGSNSNDSRWKVWYSQFTNHNWHISRIFSISLWSVTHANHSKHKVARFAQHRCKCFHACVDYLNLYAYISYNYIYIYIYCMMYLWYHQKFPMTFAV